MSFWRTARMLVKAIQVEGASREKKIRRLYELFDYNLLNKTNSYVNLGYWESGCTDLDEAAQALADLLADEAGFKPGDRVLDVGFGYGDAALHWLTSRNLGEIAGINITPLHVRAATERARRLGLADRTDFREGSATELPFESGSFDRVVALESAHHFLTRVDFFREAYRVLRPGGVLATAEILPTHPDAVRRSAVARGVPPENCYPAEEYARKLTATGYTDVSVRSIREHVYEPWRRYLARRLEEPDARAQMGMFHKQFRDRVGTPGLDSPLAREIARADYVIAVAGKPPS
ncbi:class I SAM-dependent methyltransferase [Kibdelosporangium persicum]|uniref:Class I SAM-dependent methyltransferase n=1 Tax=Kibdelosporangium persicum TaxID=2698649 RepID=A0ABX2F658_9PSEU|nr:class I SAM-dependent methyltransferase [Kibdelosporangium persicum]NRN66377.1 Class I SAM-dependent methyltransferase [Kibdelosporangium persicum]